MKKETFFIIIISALALFFSNLPFIYGYIFAKPELYYLGRKVINSYDTYTYIAFIEQSRQGRFLFENLYSLEPQHATLIRPLYVLLGKLALFVGVYSDQIYTISRFFLGALFCFVLFKFLKRFFEKPQERIAAFTLVLFSTGLGYILQFAFPASSDLWIPESNTFMSLGEAPHFILSQILMLLSFTLFVDGVEKKKYINFLLTGACLALLSLEHPFNIFVTFAVIFVMTVVFLIKKVINQQMIWFIGFVFAVQIVGVCYQVYETKSNAVLSLWFQNNPLPSPSPINFIIGLGIILPLMVIGLEKYLKKTDSFRLLAIAWVISTFVLLYSPLSFQRRVSEGMHIPIAIMAAEGMFIFVKFLTSSIFDSAKQRVFNALIVALIVFSSVGSFLLAFLELRAISKDEVSSYAYSVAKPELVGMQVLRDHTTFDDGILTNSYYGNIVPGITGRKVFVGHRVQTPYFEQKINQANEFLLETDDKKAYSFLKKNHITFIFLGVNDGLLTYGFKPDTKPYLERAYFQNGVSIYHVR